MKTLTLENINEADLDLFVSLAIRLEIKVEIRETASESTDCINRETGQYLTREQFRQTVADAEKEPGIGKEEFARHMDTWKKRLIV